MSVMICSSDLSISHVKTISSVLSVLKIFRIKLQHFMQQTGNLEKNENYQTRKAAFVLLNVQTMSNVKKEKTAENASSQN